MKNLTVLLCCFLMSSVGFCQESGSTMDAEKQKKEMSAMAAETTVETNDDEMMKKWMELISLGDEHKILAKDVGIYAYKNTFWSQPGAPAMTSEGKTTIESIMDGRYFIETHEGQAMGMPFHGMSVYGYDKIEKAYVSTWIDNMGTGILKFTGNYDDTGALVSTARAVNPMTGVVEGHKVVTKSTENGSTMDYYIIGAPGAPEFHSMHIDYTKMK